MDYLKKNVIFGTKTLISGIFKNCPLKKGNVLLLEDLFC